MTAAGSPCERKAIKSSRRQFLLRATPKPSASAQRRPFHHLSACPSAQLHLSAPSTQSFHFIETPLHTVVLLQIASLCQSSG